MPMRDRLYLRPTGFVDRTARAQSAAVSLAGGLTAFCAVEVILATDGNRITQQLVPVGELDTVLGRMPDLLRRQGYEIFERLRAARAPLHFGELTLSLDRPEVMGIVNATPDSFSDGSAETDAAIRALKMIDAGATVIDVGGESTRPGAKPVSEDEEIARVRPVVKRLATAGAIISIDTRKAGVMEAALDAGAAIVNDVSALTWDGRAPRVAAARDCPVVLMHHQGTPETMQQNPRYGDVLLEVYDWLETRIEAAVAAGIDRAKILIDPGIGFGKTLHHNLTILNGLSLFHGLGCPIVLGVSRKRTIGALSNDAPVDQRLGGSVALAVLGAAQGVQLLRVHDVFETVQAMRVWCGLRDAPLAPLRSKSPKEQR
jgi:dihydropteroate synthase